MLATPSHAYEGELKSVTNELITVLSVSSDMNNCLLFFQFQIVEVSPSIIRPHFKDSTHV